jgi:hypothetical protein
MTLGLSACWEPITVKCGLTPADWNAIEGSGSHSTARVWNELALHAIRSVLPQPTVHARNLYHLSAAMYDAWATTDSSARGVFWVEKQASFQTEAERSAVIAYAAHRVLQKRYASTQGKSDVLDCLDEGLRRVGLDPLEMGVTGSTPAALGNRIGQAVLDATLNDGANEAHQYSDTTGYVPVNPPLRPIFPGVIGIVNPDAWEPLLLEQPFTQNGIPQSGPQAFVTPHWREVQSFAMQRRGRLYHDPGPTPSVSSDVMRDVWIVDVIRKQSMLDANDESTLDVSPASLGNSALGSNDGAGHRLNPVTGKPYEPVLTKQSDYWRVVAEYWADGPKSETPPGHWNVVANTVADHPEFQRKIGGTGAVVSALEWDVKLYLALNGALHDAAITAWEIKRDTSTARPISLVRYMATRDPRGLPLIPGLIEQRDGQIQVRSWQGGGVHWNNAASWVPYQRPDFVTPAFPGFVSGHSIFSRAAAEVLTDFTGSAFFPGGLLETVAPPGFIKIDALSNQSAVKMQWATYFDAADQAGQSRLWGGIHIEPDDLTGRKLGHLVGLDAAAKARQYFSEPTP